MTVLANPAAFQDKTISVPQRCIHCETPLNSSHGQFCCAGCEYVYGTINALGLQGFYRKRMPGDKARASAVIPQKKFDYLSDPDVLKKIVDAAPSGFSRVRFYLPTVHCSACVWLLEKLPEIARGVKESRVSFRSGTISIIFDAQLITVGEIAQVLNSIGYPPVPATDDVTARRRLEEDRALLRRIGVAAVCAANTMMMADSLAQGAITGIEESFRWFFLWASVLMTLPAVVYSASPFYRAAFGALLVGSMHLDVPIAAAILLSYGAGILHAWQGNPNVYFDSITCLILLLLIARYAQRRALHKARASTLTTWDLFPSVVRMWRDDTVCEKPLRELAIGDVVDVRPGDRVPADGVVMSGESALESSFLTGESRPVDVREGSAVLGGAINLQSTLRVRVDAIGRKTRLGAILAGLEEAHEKRTELESRVHILTNRFVACVLIAACATFAAWLYLDASRALDITIALLIVTCPCALGLAIPTALSVALAQAQRHGIFVKNAEALNLLADAEHFYFDKTGTLTEGRMEVGDCIGDARSIALAKCLAARASAHPVAAALAHMEARGAPLDISRVAQIAGKGVTGLFEGRNICLGSLKWSRERGVVVDTGMTEVLTRWQAQGASVCILDDNSQAIAAFKLLDTVRPAAEQLVTRLRREGKQSFIISGDSQAVVNCVADRLLISRSFARGELSPEEKAEAVAADPAVTVMIGDGLNDARAMQKSKIAIGVSGGIEATLECADIFVANNGEVGIDCLYEGARRTQRVVLRNITYSIIYNVLGASLAVTGFITPVFAAILMPLSSLTVVLSSLLGRYFSPRGRC